MSQSKFGVEMGKKFQKTSLSGYVYYVGVRLRRSGSPVSPKSSIFDEED